MQTKRREGESDAMYMFRNIQYAALACCIAEVATIPIDSVKVRLQLQKTPEGEVPRYKGLLGTMAKVTAEEGPFALFKGLVPGLQRQIVFNGLSIGLYVPIRDLITGPMAPGENPSLLQKIAAGIATGAFGITIANPTDVVKVRMQAQARLPEAERPYSNSVDCYRQILSKNGPGGLWVGWGPNVARNSIINAAKLASYDQIKQTLNQSFGIPEGKPLQISSAFASGFVATVVGSPLDVLKTRLMNAPPG